MAAFAKEIIKEIDSISTCHLPQIRDRKNENKIYEGEYVSPGRKSIVINVKDNLLQYKLSGTNFFSPHLLYRNADDYFCGNNLNMLFVKSQEGQIEKAWCQSKGESFWVTKSR
ncbi:MAG: hypothetical protein ABJA37_00815, partial [Ferruginibacter sp.]